MGKPPGYTQYQSQSFAWALTGRAAGDSVESLGSTLVDAQVDLNPHQVDAALFAFRNPLSGRHPGRRGRAGQDHRGRAGHRPELGGAQAPHPGHRPGQPAQAVAPGTGGQVLPALPSSWKPSASTRPSSRATRPLRSRAEHRHLLLPVRREQGRRRRARSRGIWWSSTRPTGCATSTSRSNVIANTLKQALAQLRKVLLTATPLQNSLLELYGLVSIIDEHAFGDLQELPRAVRQHRANEHVFQTLQGAAAAHLQAHPAQAGAGVHPVHQAHARWSRSSRPSRERAPALRLVSEYLRRRQSLGPAGQPALAHDPDPAEAAGVVHLRHRRHARAPWPTGCKAGCATQEPAESLEDELAEDYEALDETAEEWDDDDPPSAAHRRATARPSQRRSPSCDDFAAPGHVHRAQLQGRGPAHGAGRRLRQGRPNSAPRRRPSSSPSPAAPRSTCFALLADSPTAKASSCSTAPTPTRALQAHLPDWLERHAGTDASPARAPPTCAPRWSSTSASSGRS